MPPKMKNHFVGTVSSYIVCESHIFRTSNCNTEVVQIKWQLLDVGHSQVQQWKEKISVVAQTMGGGESLGREKLQERIQESAFTSLQITLTVEGCRNRH